jgi:hypothetical protein
MRQNISDIHTVSNQQDAHHQEDTHEAPPVLRLATGPETRICRHHIYDSDQQHTRERTGDHDTFEHWVKFPEHWQQTTKSQRPMGHLFYPTGLRMYDPATGMYHYWQSRASRKRVHHTQRPRKPAAPLCCYFVCWKPHLFAWWTAISFGMGSVFFILVASLQLSSVAEDNASTWAAIGGIALLGAFMFFIGSINALGEVIQAPITVTSPGYETMIWPQRCSRNHGTDAGFAEPNVELAAREHPLVLFPRVSTDLEMSSREQNGFDLLRDIHISTRQKLWILFGQWRRIDFSLCWIRLVGALLFVVKSFGGVGDWSHSTKSTDYGLFVGLIVVTAVVASSAFVVTGYLLVVETSHQWFIGLHPTNLGWQVAIWSLLGGLSFLGNGLAICLAPSKSVSIPILLLIGAACFLLTSMCLWLEQCWRSL